MEIFFAVDFVSLFSLVIVVDVWSTYLNSISMLCILLIFVNKQ